MQDYQILLCESVHLGESMILDKLDDGFSKCDFDRNGKIDTGDVRILMQYVKDPNFESIDNVSLPTEITWDNVKERVRLYGDIDRNGVIDEKDQQALLRCIALGIDSTVSFFKEIPLCELGSSSSTFLGKATKPIFYSKIDGTHELSFSLPAYYLDENTGAIIDNELIDYISNKDRVRLKKWNSKKNDYDFFSLTVNTKVDKDDKGLLIYEYTCTDSFIEELSKTGYEIAFHDEPGETGGLGTIHELAERILEGSDWEYVREKTGTLLEYKTDLEYNVEQERYDTVYRPIPTHPVEYIEELNRYCNKLDNELTLGDKQIYCYEDTSQITSNTVQNLFYNASYPNDTIGWKVYELIEGTTAGGQANNKIETKTAPVPYIDPVIIDGKTRYRLRVDSNAEETKTIYLLNDLSTSSNRSIQANQPYVFYWKSVIPDFNNDYANNQLLSFQIYDKNPLLYPNAAPAYELKASDINKNYLASRTNYIVKTKTSISNPYFVFKIKLTIGTETSNTMKNFFLYESQLYELKGKAIKDNDGNIKTTAEQNNLNLLSTYINGSILPEEVITNDQICSIEQPSVSAYTEKKMLYFYIDDTEEGENTSKIHYLDFATEVIDTDKISISEDNKEDWEGSEDLNSGFDPNAVYYSEEDKYYYQYYTLERNGVTNSIWDFALLGEGANDKRRTLIAEKSNRFNLLQELSELFKAWCVFSISEREDGTLKKQIWFKENSINTNFSGFHKGINLQSLERKSDSNNIVTKLYVENQENSYADNGFVSVVNSPLNPWGENYFYNFRYYVDNHFFTKKITTTKKTQLKVDYDLEKLYSTVKGLNDKILKNNLKLVQLTSDLSTLQQEAAGNSVILASIAENIASLSADLENENISTPNINTINDSISRYESQKIEIEKKQTQLIDNIAQVTHDIEKINEENSDNQENKTYAIRNFEREYSPFIKEGIWSDSSYVDDNTYYLDAQKVANTSSMPQTDWTISVLDGNAIRDLQDYVFEVGDQTVLTDNEFFRIENNPTQNYVFEVLISGIQENLDNALENKIEVRNYLTSFEDIFQRISAATQTVELKEHIYDQAAKVTSGNQIDQGIFQNTLLNNGLILANATDNSYKLDDSGLTLQSKINPAKRMRIIADGIFISNSVDEAGNPKWRTGITADGINASVLTAGEINTSLIRIYSKNQPSQTWNALGITSYQLKKVITEGVFNYEVLPNRFVRFDNFGFYFVNEDENSSDKDHIWNFDDNGRPWFENKTREDALSQIENYSALSITENGFRINLKFTEDMEKFSSSEYNIITKLQQGNLYFGKVVFDAEDEFTGMAMLSNLDISANDEIKSYFTGFVFRNNVMHEINSWKFDPLGSMSITDISANETEERKTSFSAGSVAMSLTKNGVKTTDIWYANNKLTVFINPWKFEMSENSCDFSYSDNEGSSYTDLLDFSPTGVKIRNSLEIPKGNKDWSFIFSSDEGLTIQKNQSNIFKVITRTYNDGTKHDWVGIYGDATVADHLNIGGGATISGGGLDVTGDVTLNNKFTVSGLTTLNNGLNVYKGLSIYSNGLSVTGGATINDGLSVNDSMTYLNEGLTIRKGGTLDEAIVPTLWFTHTTGHQIALQAVPISISGTTSSWHLYFGGTRIA